MTNPDDTDLQAALDASANMSRNCQPVVNSPEPPAAASTSSVPTAPSDITSPVVTFNVSNFVEFKAQCTAMIKRLQDPTASSYVELPYFQELIRASLDGRLGEEGNRYVIKDVFIPAMNQVFTRTYTNEPKDIELVQGVIQGLLDVVAQHQLNNLPQPLPPLPTIQSLPVELLKPPQPPDVPSSSATTTSPPPTATSLSSSTAHSHVQRTITMGGYEIPIAEPIGPQPGESPPSNSTDKPVLAQVVEEGQEQKSTEASPVLPQPPAPIGQEQTATPVAASVVPPTSSSSSPSTQEPVLDVIVDRVEEPQPTFFDIARGGSTIASPPARLSTPGLNAANSPNQATSPAPNLSSTPASANSAAQNNRDLDQTILELLDLLFDDRKGFYVHHGSERPKEDPLYGVSTVPPHLEQNSEEMLQFRRQLKVDDWVDVLADPAKDLWKCARICEEKKPEPPAETTTEPSTTEPAADQGEAPKPATGELEGEWRIHYEGQPESVAMEWMKQSAHRFSPLYSRVGLIYDGWRFNLQVGDACDACDYLGKWYTARVVAVRGALLQISYDDWGDAFNEWFVRTSSRLDQFKTHAIGGKHTGGVLATYADRKYNDVNDLSTDYAVFRGKEWGSYWLVKNIDYFQRKHQGFDLLIQRLVHKHGPNGVQPSMGIPTLRKLIECFTRVFHVMSKPHAQRLFPLLRLAVTETILGLNDIELRGLSKEHLEEMVKCLERILARIHGARDVTAFLECFTLESAYKRFECPIVERRINGMSYFQEYTQMVRRSYSSTWLNAAGYIEWLSRHDIFPKVFSPEKGHPELMKKSAEILRFIIVEQRFETMHLDLIWSALKDAMKRMEESRLEIVYKVLDDIAWNLNVSHITYLFNKVRTDIPLKEYSIGTLDLIKELTRFTHRAGPEASRHAMDLLWMIIQDESGASEEIKFHARSRLEDIGVHQKNMRLHYLEKACTENLKCGASIPQTISLMQKLIDSFPENMPTYYHSSSSSGEDQTRNHVIMYLNEQFHLMQYLFEDMERFKLRAKELATEQFPQQMAATSKSGKGVKSLPGINSMLVVPNNKSAYLKQVQDRLSFLQYLLVSSNSGTVTVVPPPVVSASNPSTSSSDPVDRPTGPPPSAAEAARALAELEMKEKLDARAKSKLAVVVDEEKIEEKELESKTPEIDQSSVTSNLQPPPKVVDVPTTTVTPDPPLAMPEIIMSQPQSEVSEVLWEAAMRFVSSSSVFGVMRLADRERFCQIRQQVAQKKSRPSVDLLEEIDKMLKHQQDVWQNFQKLFAVTEEMKSPDGQPTHSAITGPPGGVQAPIVGSSAPPPPGSQSAAVTTPVVGLKLNADQIDSLWRNFYIDSLSSAERETFLRWIRNACVVVIPYQPPPSTYSSYVPPAPPQPKSFFATPDLLHHVFNDLLLGYLDPPTIELSYYLAFQQGFLSLNQKEGMIEIKPQTPNSNYSSSSSSSVDAFNYLNADFTVLDFDHLNGFDALWSMCLETPQESTEVVTKSIEFLNKLYSPTNLSEKLLETSNEGKSGISGIANIRLHYIEKCINTFKSDLLEKKSKSDAPPQSTNPHRASRCLFLLHHLLDTSENLKGLGGLRSHGTQTRGRLLRLYINHHGLGTIASQTSLAKKIQAAAASSGENGPQKMSINVYSNDTLFDLRSLLSKELLIPLDLIKLYISGTQLTPDLNRMHLHELKIKDQQSILVSRKQVHITKIELTNKEDPARPMMPLFRQAMSEIFYKYATTDNKFVTSEPQKTMSKNDMAHYILSCGAGETSANDDRLTNIFKKFALPAGWTNYDELTVDGFCEFYRDACGDRVDNVWSDLRVHGYRHDLRKESDILLEESKLQDDPKYKEENSKVLPRYLLASKNEYFTLLFQALLDHQLEHGTAGGGNTPKGDIKLADDESHSISSLTWSLLQRLPSNQELYMNLFSLDGLQKTGSTDARQSWDELLDSRNVYKLLYALQILESLTEPIQDETTPTPATTAATVAASPSPSPAAQPTPTPTENGTDGASPSPAPVVVAPSEADLAEQKAKQEERQATLKLRDQWSRKFLNSGGFQHLYSILVDSHLFEEAVKDSTPTHQSTQTQTVHSTPLTRSLRKKCLTLLLKMLYYYLLAAMNHQTPSAAALAANGGSAAAENGLGFVSRIRSESIDVLTESEKEEENRAIEAERQRVEQENRNSGGATMFTPPANPIALQQQIYGPNLPFQNGNGPIVNPSAPPAPAMSGSGTATSPIVIEEVKSDDGPNNKDDAANSDRLPSNESRPDLFLLGRQMSSGFSNAVLNCVNFPQLQKVLWHIIALAGEKNTPNSQPTPSTEVNPRSPSPNSSTSTAVVLYQPPSETSSSNASTAATSAGTSYDQVNTDMAEPALNCLVNIMIYDAQQRRAGSYDSSTPSLLAQFYELIEEKDCIQFFQVLYDPVSVKLRKFLANTIYQICARVKLPATDSVQSPQQYFLALLLKHLPSHTRSKEQNFSTEDCNEYFWLLSKLLQNRITNLNDNNLSNSNELRSILQILLKHLHAHTSREVPDLSASTSNTLVNPNSSGNLSSLTSPKPDSILIGLLSLLNDILVKFKDARLEVGQGEQDTNQTNDQEAHGLVHQLFFEYLFTPPLPPQTPIDPLSTVPIVLPTPPKCQTKPSRQIAFKLLTTLCQDVKENFTQLYHFIQAQQTAIQLRMRAAAAAATTTTSSSSAPAIGPLVEYNPASLMISPSGYVGLKNLGSTCYMNSLLQQFFMIPAFRYGILQALPTKLVELQKSGSPDALADHLLYQLQNLFGSLSISHKQFVDTTNFCKSYKDEMGQPVNVRMQQDAQEFFNVLMDRIEFLLKTDARYSKLISNLFEGKLINQMICHGGCESIRETRENFMTLSLEVKGKLKMEESLKAYVEGENLQGINCDVCKKKVPETTKRVCLGHLPHSIFFHLKRFELNFETFQHEKLNNRFEFPIKIDMEPYTKEGLARIEAEKRHLTDPTVEVPEKYSLHPKEYYEYSLFGILVHTGSAQSGHYYSFIKERVCEIDHPNGSGQTILTRPNGGQWYEFNDREIRSFDIVKDLDEQAFGGESTTSEKSSWGMESMSTSERIKNAYMLCYEREGQYKQISQRANETPKETAPVAAVTAAGDASASPAPASTEVFPPIEGIPSNFMTVPLSSILPQRIQSQVLQDNAYFMEDRFIFSPEYYSFMHEVLKNAANLLPPETSTVEPNKAVAENGAAVSNDFALDFIRQFTIFLLDTLLRSADSKTVSDYITTLSELYSTHLSACAWFIDYISTGGSIEQMALPLQQRKPPSPQLLVELLLNTREAYIRKAVLMLVMVCLNKLLPDEKQQGLWDGSRPDAWSIENTSKSRIQRYFLLHHSQLAETAPKHWMRFHEYLQFYHLFTDITGITGRRFMIAQGVLAGLVDMYLQDASPLALADKKKKRATMGNIVNQPSFSFLLQTVSILGRTCYQPKIKRVNAPGQEPVELALPIPPTILPDAVIQTVVNMPTIVGTPPLVDGVTKENGGGEPDANGTGASESEANVTFQPQTLTMAQAFTDLDYQLLTCKDLYANAFGQGEHAEYIIPLACHMSFENIALTTEIIQIIINGVHKSDANNVRPFFDLMAATVAINDSLQTFRYDKLLAPGSGVLHSLYVYRDHSAKFTYVSIKFLCRIMQDTPAFAARMMAIRQQAWLWIDLWLKNYSEKKPVITSSASSSHSSTPAKNPTKITAARQETYATYCRIVESNGSTINLEPPPVIMIGDSKGNISVGSATGAGTSDATINRPDLEGKELATSSSPTDPETETKKTLLAAGIPINPDYIPKHARSRSDDPFEEDEPSNKSRKRDHGLSIIAPDRTSSDVSSDPGMVEPAGSGDAMVDDEERGPGLVDADDESDAKSSTYQPRTIGPVNQPTKNSDIISCPVCTYDNPSTSRTCDVCESPLK